MLRIVSLSFINTLFEIGKIYIALPKNYSLIYTNNNLYQKPFATNFWNVEIKLLYLKSALHFLIFHVSTICSSRHLLSGFNGTSNNFPFLKNRGERSAIMAALFFSLYLLLDLWKQDFPQVFPNFLVTLCQRQKKVNY